MAVQAMPVEARQAMLRGIDENTIIVGAYVDSSIGGVCPMLAAHRNGERVSLASFARSWDRYTDANGRRPRRATGRELRTLRSLLEESLIEELASREPGPSIDEAVPERVWVELVVHGRPSRAVEDLSLIIK